MLITTVLLASSVLAENPLPAPLYFDTNDAIADHSAVPVVAP